MKLPALLLLASCLLLAPPAPAQEMDRPGTPQAPAPLPGDSIATLRDKAKQAENDYDFDTAIQCWTMIIQRSPGDATALFSRARDYESIDTDGANEHSAKAMADLNEAIRLDPKYVDAFVARGALNDKDGHHANAIADYNEAIRLDPKKLSSYQSLAATYEDLGQHEKALAVYDDAVRANPDDSDAYWNRGVFCQITYPDKAIADFTEVIRRNPDLATAYDRRAYAYAGTGDWDHAIADYTKVIQLAKPGDDLSSSSYKARADAYAKKKQWDLAKADLDKLIARENAGGGEPGSEDYDAYVARGDALRGKGDYAHALVDYTVAIHSEGAQQADRDTAHSGRGMTYWALGQKDKAIADFTRAVQLHLNGYDCVILARAEYATGQFDKAIAHCTLGIVRCDMGIPAFILRGAAHAAKGDDKLAAHNFRTALTDAIDECRKSKWKDPAGIDELAAVESRLGKFDMAVRHELMALDLAGKKNSADTLAAMQARLALYRQNKPWLEENQPVDSEAPDIYGQ